MKREVVYTIGRWNWIFPLGALVWIGYITHGNIWAMIAVLLASFKVSLVEITGGND